MTVFISGVESSGAAAFSKSKAIISGKQGLPSLIYSYMTENPKIKSFQTDVKRNLPADGNIDAKGNLVIVCDTGTGNLSKELKTLISRVPFILDIQLENNLQNKKHAMIDFAQYKNAEIISLDADTLNIMKLSPEILMTAYGIKNLVVNHKLHSIWFSTNKIVDFKYEDGQENEATYESKREIVAGFAAEYILSNYRRNDNVINIVFRDYWKEHFQSEKKITYGKANKLLELNGLQNIKNKISLTKIR